jgi:hypothetical protein
MASGPITDPTPERLQRQRAALPRLVLFSGLGLDERFVEAMGALDGIVARVQVRPWLEPEDNETIPAYAQRMVASLEGSGPVYLGGPSFGGMVALEAARHVDCAGVLLVSSCTQGRALAWYVRAALGLAGRAPLWTISAGLYLAPLAMRLFGRIDRRGRQRMISIWAACDRKVARWGARQITRWKLTAPPPAPVWHQHGWIDHIIPRARVRPSAWVSAGGHLINLTHPRQVNRFLAQHLRQAPAQIRIDPPPAGSEAS